MAEQKTKPTAQAVESFLDKIESEQVRDDCAVLIKIMKKATGAPPKMWGPSIIGFGQYHYTYDSGHEGDSCLVGFSPRKANISLYVMGSDKRERLLEKLGKHKAAKGCVYIKKLEDVNLTVLEELVKSSVEALRKKYPAQKK